MTKQTMRARRKDGGWNVQYYVFLASLFFVPVFRGGPFNNDSMRM